MELIKDSWYKIISHNNEVWYFKYSHIENDTIAGTDYIYPDGKFMSVDISLWGYENKYKLELVDISEIFSCLPEDHIDKLIFKPKNYNYLIKILDKYEIR